MTDDPFARPDWWPLGACADLNDPDLFFPEHYGKTADINRAKAVCRGCLVRGLCLQWALDQDERWGIWGGATPNERAVMLGRRVRRHRRVA